MFFTNNSYLAVNKRDENKKHSLFLMSLLFAFFCDIKCINWSLVYGGFVGEGMMTLLYIVTIIFVIILSLLNNPNFIARIRPFSIALIMLLIVWFYLTFYYIGPPRVSVYFFLVFTIFSILLPQLFRVDTKTVLKAVMFYPFFALFRLDMVFRPVTDWREAMNMDAAYSFLIPVIASILYLLYYFKEEHRRNKFFMVLLLFVNAVYMVEMLLFSQRGPILSIILLLMFCYIVKVQKNSQIKIVRSKFVVGIMLMLLVSFFLIPVVGYLYSMLSGYGLKIYSLEKVLNLNDIGDVSNGRDFINGIAIDGFIESPILGHGIDRFYANTGQFYPHNFVLQTMYDGGLLLVLLLFVPIVYFTVKQFKCMRKDQFIMFCFLFFSSVPAAFFSQDMWEISILWVFFGFVLSKDFVVERLNP